MKNITNLSKLNELDLILHAKRASKSNKYKFIVFYK